MGTREIALAVTATTISLVVIFLPVAFMGGLVGKFWNSFGLTATFAIMVSLVVAFTLTPMLAARIFQAAPVAPPGQVVAGHGPSPAGFYHWFERGYEGAARVVPAPPRGSCVGVAVADRRLRAISC